MIYLNACWIPPLPDWFKLNSNGTFLERLHTLGAGVILQDYHICFVGGLSMPIDSGTVLIVEVWAVKIGLQLANKLECHKLIVETDSHVVYKWMKNTYQVLPYDLRYLWIDIQDLLSGLEAVKFEWTPREENRAADCLASFAHNQAFILYDLGVSPHIFSYSLELLSHFPPRSLIWTLNLPSWLMKFVNEDMRGVSIPRDMITFVVGL